MDIAASIDHLWALERELWIVGHDLREEILSDYCVVNLGPRYGTAHGEAAKALFRRFPHFVAVQMDECEHDLADVGTCGLAYMTTVTDEDGIKRRYACSSTWMRNAGRWALTQHQRSPRPVDGLPREEPLDGLPPEENE